MILKKSNYKILSLIYENPGIRLNEIIRKSKTSVGSANLIIDDLKEDNAIKEDALKGEKKIILRRFYPNLITEESIILFSLIELEKKKQFFNKNTNLINPFKELANDLKEIKVILIFGSYANFSETKESDLDILFLINKKYDKDAIKKTIERCFVTFDNEISPRITSFSELKQDKNLFNNIIKNHILIKGINDFIKGV